MNPPNEEKKLEEEFTEVLRNAYRDEPKDFTFAGLKKWILPFITEQRQKAREEGKREAALIAAEHMDAIPFMRFTTELLPSTTSPTENKGSSQ